jgi:hypothetical protein
VADADAVGEVVTVLESVSDNEAEGELEEDNVDVNVSLLLALNDPVAVPDAELLGDGDTVLLMLIDSVLDGVAVPLIDRLLETLAESVRERDHVTLPDVLCERVADVEALTDMVIVDDGLRVALPDVEVLGVRLVLAVGDPVALGLTLEVAVAVPLTETVVLADIDGEGLSDGVPVALKLWVLELVGVPLADEVGDSVTEHDVVRLPLRVRLALPDCEYDSVSETLAERVRVSDDVMLVDALGEPDNDRLLLPDMLVEALVDGV